MAQYDKLINLSLLSEFLTKAKATFAPKITASGLLKGDGAGGVSAATPGTDYLAPSALVPYRTAAAQDLIDAGKEAAGLGLTGAAVGDLVRVAAVDANGKPTSWARVTQDEITKMSAKADELAIVINGNTSSLGAAKGQYVILRNSSISGKADGLYTAAAAIPANTAIDATYLTAVVGGGLNEITNSVSGTPAIGTGVITSYTWYRTYGKLVFVSINFKKVGEALPTNTILLSGFPAPAQEVNIVIGGINVVQNVKIPASGNMIVDGKTVSTQVWYGGSCMYIMA